MAKGKAKVEDLDTMDDDVEAEDAKPAKQEVTFGVADLAKHLSEVTGKEVKTRELRTLIRKMAREDTPRVEREVVAGNRSRYDWPKGLKDPEVKAIIAAVTKGEIEEGKQEALAKLKSDKAAKKAAKDAEKGSDDKPAKGKGKKAAAKAAAAEAEGDDDDSPEDDSE